MLQIPAFSAPQSPCLSDAAVIVGWESDAGKLGGLVVDYLVRKLKAEECAEIEPVGFFPLDGVQVEGDIAVFPEAKFYCCERNNLLLFRSALPVSDSYGFLNLVLEVAGRCGHVREMYTVGGMVSFVAHTAARDVFALPNSPEMKGMLQRYGLAGDVDYETPPGQGTTLNSFLLWVARQRELGSAGIWTAVPFYMTAVQDFRACRQAAMFFDARFGLDLDFVELDEAIGRQDEKMAWLMSSYPEVDRAVRKTEEGVALTEEEMESLVMAVEEHLGQMD